MTNLTGSRTITYTATAGEVIKISYENINPAVDILNKTAGTIKVNNTGDFSGNSYFIIPESEAYDHYRPNLAMNENTSELYIKTEAAGMLSIVIASY